MNILIRDLAQQARVQADYYAMLSDHAEKNIFAVKFAELILTKVTETLINNGYSAAAAEIHDQFIRH